MMFSLRVLKGLYTTTNFDVDVVHIKLSPLYSQFQASAHKIIHNDFQYVIFVLLILHGKLRRNSLVKENVLSKLS